TSGPKVLYAWAKDATGNISNSASGTVNITIQVIECPPGYVGVDDTHCRIFLTSTELSYWTAPEGWSNFGNKIEVIGAGGGGGASSGGLTGSMWKATGGGGGAYSAIRNFFVEEPGVTQVPYRVGAGGSGHTVGNIPLGQ